MANTKGKLHGQRNKKQRKKESFKAKCEARRFLKINFTSKLQRTAYGDKDQNVGHQVASLIIFDFE